MEGSQPGYWKKSPTVAQGGQTAASQTTKPEQTSCNGWGALQDVCLEKDPVFVGLLSMVTGRALQEDIAITVGDLLFRGRKILGLVPPDQCNPKLRDDDDLQQLILPGFILHD